MHSAERQPPFAPIVPVRLILILAFALRVAGLGAQSLWYDEAVSLFVSQKPLPELIAHTAGDIHPPLYYVLMHFWLGLSGTTEFAAAYFSLFFGVLLVALSYRVAQDWFGTNTAVISAFLTALSSFQLWYAQEVRMYTLAGCIALLSLWLVGRLWQIGFTESSPRFRMHAAAYCIVVAAGLYTHYYLAFLWMYEVAAIGLLLALASRPRLEDLQSVEWRVLLRSAIRSRAARWVALQFGVLLLLAPWLPTAFWQITDPPVPPWRSFVTLTAPIQEALVSVTFGQSMPLDLPMTSILVALMLLVILFGVVLWHMHFRGKAERVQSPLFLVGSIAFPLLLILAISAAVPLYHARYMYLYAGAFAIVLALGVSAVGRQSLLASVMILGVFSGASLYAEYQRRAAPSFAKDDYRAAVAYIASHAMPGDAVLINSGYIYPAFVYYNSVPVAWRGRLDDFGGGSHPEGLVIAQTGSLSPTKSLGWGSPTSDFFVTTEDATRSALGRLLEWHPRLWVLRANDTVNDPSGFTRAVLAQQAVLFDDMLVRGESFVRVQGYVARQASESAFGLSNPISITVGDRLQLIGWQSPPTVSAGSRLDVGLLWRATQPIDVDYHVSLGLYDGHGRRWASKDGVPVGPQLKTGDWAPNQLLPDAWTLEVPTGTPPGSYSLQLSVYDPFSEKALSVPGGAEGVRARLGKVIVSRGAVVRAPPWSTDPTFGTQVAMVSSTVFPGPLKPGGILRAELLWRTLSSPSADLVVTLHLVDDRGRTWATRESPPVDGEYPTSQWLAGELVKDVHEMIVPPDISDGRYRVEVSIFHAKNRERLAVRDGLLPFTRERQEIARIEVRGRLHVMKAPDAAGIPTRVKFGDQALLIGYETSMSPGISQNGVLTITLYWQALYPPQTSQKVFVHLVGGDQQIVAQRDSEPGNGTLAMTGWKEGEYLTDPYALELREGIPPGQYTIYVGVYDAYTTVRLPIADPDGKPAGDRWLLTTLRLP